MKKKERKVEDLLVWQQAISVANVIYLHFNSLNDFGFRNQIQRAAVSISNNITEGFYRKSDRDFKRFLTIALGSTGELKSMLILAIHLKYIDAEKQVELMGQLNQIGKMLNALINYLSNQIDWHKLKRREFLRVLINMLPGSNVQCPKSRRREVSRLYTNTSNV